MTIIESIILGVVQGLTEFLPVSSSGHLELGKILFDINLENNLLFSVVVHLGTALATVIVFRKEIASLISSSINYLLHSGKVDEVQKSKTYYSFLLIISAIPILLLQVVLGDKIDSLFDEKLMLVGVSLLVTTAFLISTVILDKYKPKNNELNLTKAVVIGLSQAIAVLPGISRSGATISTSLVLGVKKAEAAKFSFLMVIIPILGANTIEIYDAYSSNISVDSIGVLLFGFIASFVTGYLAIKLVLEIVQKSKLHYFAAYTFVIGIVAIIFAL